MSFFSKLFGCKPSKCCRDVNGCKDCANCENRENCECYCKEKEVSQNEPQQEQQPISSSENNE